MIKLGRSALIFVLFLQSCDCQGTWSDNLRKMDNCLKSYEGNEKFCLKQKHRVQSCSKLDFPSEEKNDK